MSFKRQKAYLSKLIYDLIINMCQVGTKGMEWRLLQNMLYIEIEGLNKFEFVEVTIRIS